jgi:YHS domain-containing protein
MKPKLTLIAVLLILASCATEITRTPDPAATHKTVAVVKAKPKAASKPKPYPLETCLVSGEGLDEMDERVATVHEGQTFEFCCKPCLVKFKKDPDKYVAKLAAATRR